jgi:hypothetical protein
LGWAEQLLSTFFGRPSQNDPPWADASGSVGPGGEVSDLSVRAERTTNLSLIHVLLGPADVTPYHPSSGLVKFARQGPCWHVERLHAAVAVQTTGHDFGSCIWQWHMRQCKPTQQHTTAHTPHTTMPHQSRTVSTSSCCCRWCLWSWGCCCCCSCSLVVGVRGSVLV